MFNNSFFLYPQKRYYPYNYGYQHFSYTSSDLKHNNIEKKDENNKESNDFCENKNSSNDQVLLEIFGLKLYFDDILIIFLLFFLFNEGVDDQYLFISLILLLLS